jgi:hypothetical protein
MEKALEQTVRVPVKDCVVFTHFPTSSPIGQTKSNQIKPGGGKCPEIGHVGSEKGRGNTGWSNPVKASQTSLTQLIPKHNYP